MPMCGQSWLGAAASFAGMWGAMMLPSIAPTLWRCPYRGRAALVGTGYFLVWAALGLIVFALYAEASEIMLRSHALEHTAPFALAIIVLLGGAYQSSRWKARALARCRSFVAGNDRAWLQGVQLGLYCSASCAGLTAILLAVGVMDWRAMALMIAAVIAERLAPAGEPVARAVGAVAIGGGMLLVARAV